MPYSSIRQAINCAIHYLCQLCLNVQWKTFFACQMMGFMLNLTTWHFKQKHNTESIKYNVGGLTICPMSYPQGKNKTPVLYFSQWLRTKHTMMPTIHRNTRNTLTPCSPLPNIQKMATGRNRVAQLSKPWSKSSPSGDDDFVLRACFPSMPSETQEKTFPVQLPFEI